MCGIFFAYGNNHKEKAISGINNLIHRGLDDVNIHSGEGYSLAHRKLAITGTSSSQPFVHERYLVAVNGELYDYQQVKDKHPFNYQSDSDSEIVLPLLLKYRFSTEFFNHLNGEFMITIYDKCENKLFLIRDRYGVKPGYYHLNGDSFLFSSEIKSFKKLIEFSFDQESLSEVLSFQYHSETRTLFKGVKSVPPGSMLTVDINSMKTKLDYYYTDNAKEIVRTPASPELVRELLTKAIERRVPNLPYAVCLSGGIDSTLIAQLALGHSQAHYYSIVFNENSQFNESEPIKEFLQINSLERYWTPIYVDNEMLAQNFEKSVIAAESVCVNSHVSAKHLLFDRIKKDKIKVSISGEGSDEIFLGYPFCLQDIGIDKSHDYLSNYMTSTISSSLPSFLTAKLSLGKNVLNLLDEAPKQEFVLSNLMKNYSLSGNKLLDGIYLWKKLCFSNYILTALGDKLEMNSTVEGRVPFLDLSLVEYMKTVHYQDKIHTLGKDLLRQSFSEYSWINRPKHPFIGPPNLFACASGQKMIDELIANGSRFLPINSEKIQLIRHDTGYQAQLCLLLSLYFLAKELFV